MTPFDHLVQLGKEIATLEGISHLLQWDQETLMPQGAAGSRAIQNQLIAKLAHERASGKGFENALSKCIDLNTGKVLLEELNESQKAALREWRDDFLQASKLPTPFIEKFAALTSEATENWRLARQAKSFSRFAPFLERLIEMSRQRAEYLGYQDHPFDALLDEHEKGTTTRKITPLFQALKEELIPFRKSLISKKGPDSSFLHQPYPAASQMKVARALISACGFDPHHGVIGLTSHPFCSSLHPTDVRVSTRIDPKDPSSNWLALLHEGGHWLYEANLPTEHFGTPLCQARSTAVHESQSKWWETLIGQSLPFWTFFYPQVQKSFPKQLGQVPLKTFHRGLNALSDTPIRVSSDEIAYPLHIVLRYDLEKDLISGDLAVRDLPKAWNAKMVEYLQIEPKNDSEGCLQDIHWACGLYGYFPTYTLGNLYAAQFFEAFKKTYPDSEERVAQGDFGFMRSWLKEQVHTHGRKYTSQELVKRITGHALMPDPYLSYLKAKYAAIYAQ
ncbi:MAG: carboxypeptidase M32 [Verrucomicrobia bacterium]|nr:carboxypeptidase M32 [Verrucomicrobiota bacterium]